MHLYHLYSHLHIITFSFGINYRIFAQIMLRAFLGSRSKWYFLIGYVINSAFRFFRLQTCICGPYYMINFVNSLAFVNRLCLYRYILRPAFIPWWSVCFSHLFILRNCTNSIKSNVIYSFKKNTLAIITVVDFIHSFTSRYRVFLTFFLKNWPNFLAKF